MIDPEPLARFLFDRQLDSYEATPDQREGAWAQEGIKDFWLAEAAAITEFMDPCGYLSP